MEFLLYELPIAHTEELTDDNRTEVDPMFGQLMIKDTVFADTGVYTCFAENAAGNDSQNNTIVIVGECKHSACQWYEYNFNSIHILQHLYEPREYP